MSPFHSTVYGCMFALTLFSLVYDILYITIDGESMWEYRGAGGKFKFLTFINQWLQPLYFGLVFFTQPLSGRPSARSNTESFCSTLHASLAFPIGVFVDVTFWSLYAIDRELVFPAILDKIIPRHHNHLTHSVHIPLLLLDKFMTYHKYPSHRKGQLILVAFALLYQCWIIYLALGTGTWAYPVLEKLNWPGRILFFGVLWVFFLVLYRIGHFITCKIWEKESDVTSVRYRSRPKQR